MVSRLQVNPSSVNKIATPDGLLAGRRYRSHAVGLASEALTSTEDGMDQDPTMPSFPTTHNIARDHLKGIVDRIERLEQDKAGIADDIKDVYAEAKALGYATKVIRKVVALRKRKPDEVREENELLEVYLHAIDDQLPLFGRDEQPVSPPSPDGDTGEVFDLGPPADGLGDTGLPNGHADEAAPAGEEDAGPTSDLAGPTPPPAARGGIKRARGRRPTQH